MAAVVAGMLRAEEGGEGGIWTLGVGFMAGGGGTLLLANRTSAQRHRRKNLHHESSYLAILSPCQLVLQCMVDTKQHFFKIHDTTLSKSMTP